MQVSLVLENGPGAKTAVLRAYEDRADAEHEAAQTATRTVLELDVQPSSRARGAQSANALAELAASHQPAVAGYAGWAGGHAGVGAGYDQRLGHGPDAGHGGIGTGNVTR